MDRSVASRSRTWRHGPAPTINFHQRTPAVCEAEDAVLAQVLLVHQGRRGPFEKNARLRVRCLDLGQQLFQLLVAVTSSLAKAFSSAIFACNLELPGAVDVELSEGVQLGDFGRQELRLLVAVDTGW